MNVLELFSTELLTIASTLLAILIAGILFFAVRDERAKSAWRQAEAALSQQQWLTDIVWSVVENIRVDGVEAKEYAKEAIATGRDYRLVAAYREIEQICSEVGIPFNLQLTISLIERVLRQQKEQLAEEKRE